jgi:hypothetical protein
MNIEDKNTTIEAKTTSFLAGSSAAAGPAIANKKGKSKAKKRKAKNSNAKAEVPTKNDLEDDGAPLKAPPNSPTLAGAPAPSQEGNVAPYSSMLGEDVWENEWTEFFNQPPGTLPAWD